MSFSLYFQTVFVKLDFLILLSLNNERLSKPLMANNLLRSFYKFHLHMNMNILIVELNYCNNMVGN